MANSAEDCALLFKAMLVLADCISSLKLNDGLLKQDPEAFQSDHELIPLPFDEKEYSKDTCADPLLRVTQ